GWQLQDAAKVAATGDAVSALGYRPVAWHKATVPGTVLTSLVDDGVYPEPLYGENNRPERIPESLCRTSYWYRTQFVVPRSYAGRQVWLHFDGINYSAEVWVNGHDLGSVKGAFARGLFDVTPCVAIGQMNALAVHVLPQPHPGVTHEKTLATGTGRNGGDTARDGPTFLCTVGWDWMPGIRDRDTGIWQGVRLSATGPVVVQNPYVTSDLPLPRTDTADLTVQATLKNVTGQPQAGTLAGEFGGTTFRHPVSLGPGEARTVTLTAATVPQLHLVHPRLWWPNGYGPQNLYTLHLRFDTGKTASDGQDVTFGIRSITYFVPGSDNLTLSVNGVPIMAKGGDWGMDEALKRIPAKRLDAQVRMHRLANYTIIRNWVGQSTSEDFYESCDKYGILVWDEFFQPNPADGPNPDDPDLYLANVREKLLRFRNHPCIALWCARNEGDPPPAIDRGIQALIAGLERQRLYQRSSTSGHGVNSGGPYHWQPPRSFYRFGEAFKTEIGAPSIPTLEAVQAMMPPKDWETINDDWAEHDFTAGAQGGDWYSATVGARYGGVSGLADFVRKSQFANYECFRAMYEGRFARLFHPATGVITWMSNPAQPSFVWQLYSHDLEPNASLFGVRKACEPIHIQMNQSDWHVMVINNTPQPLTGVTAKVTVYNLDGSLRYTHADSLTAAPSAATDTGAIAFPGGLSPVHFVKLELRDAHKKLLSDNFYWRANPDHEDDFQALNTLPTVMLAADVTRRDSGGKCLLTVTLRNPSRTPALMAHVQLRRRRSNQRVLPVFYSDNYISLLPGEEKTITAEAAQEDLGGDAPLVTVDGWNVTVRRTDAVMPNPAAGVAGVPRVLNINSGGGWVGPFSGDTDVEGGQTKTVGDPIDTSAPNAAPAQVYQSERWGECTYAIPVTPGRVYTVRLHFAETTYDAPGARKFNVDINGRRALTDYDVFADAGGRDRAVVKDFPSVRPDADGRIVIAFAKGSADQPKINGIQILPATP
ncbi:MAG: glycoside hydrolase family 2, partial [Armatimonadetes bacterium]|nr:glycoside hydrolase family 2 [Armatimonadota bacterium]